MSVRLDGNVANWLKANGKGHLTRINDILTNLMEAERRPRTAGSRQSSRHIRRWRQFNSSNANGVSRDYSFP